MNVEAKDNGFEHDPSALVDRHRVIEQGLDHFLDRSKSILSDQNFDRASRHLLKIFKDYNNLSPFIVENHLYKLLEYKQYDVNAIDSDDSGDDTWDNSEFAEELLMDIIITADRTVRNPNYKPPRLTFKGRISLWFKRINGLPWIGKMAFLIFVLLIFASPMISYQYSIQTKEQYEIGASAANELKELVRQVSEREEQHGRYVSVTSIWKDIKASRPIADLGYKSSYKHFSIAQYNEAKKYLLERIARLEAEPVLDTGGSALFLFQKYYQKSSPYHVPVFLFILLAGSGYVFVTYMKQAPLVIDDNEKHKHENMEEVIGKDAVETLQKLAKELLQLKKAQGESPHFASIWKEIKENDLVAYFGYKTSYKEFSVPQYEAARKFLETEIEKLNKSVEGV